MVYCKFIVVVVEGGFRRGSNNKFLDLIVNGLPLEEGEHKANYFDTIFTETS